MPALGGASSLAQAIRELSWEGSLSRESQQVLERLTIDMHLER